jgi:hypothetical protein
MNPQSLKPSFTRIVAVGQLIVLLAVPSRADDPGLVINVRGGSDLVAVRNEVRQLNKAMTGDIIVKLESGYYRLSEPLVFTGMDSGSGGHRVIWRNADSGLPVLSGSREVTGWVAGPAGIVSAAVNPGHEFRQLYVNGLAAKRAQLTAAGTFVRVQCDPINKRFYLAEGDADRHGITGWGNLADVELNVKNTFRLVQFKLARITRPGDGRVYLEVSEMSSPYMDDSWEGSADGTRIYYFDILIENAAEFIDEPGEWYLDRSMNRVYYKLRPGESAANLHVQAPFLETLVDINGADNLVFFGLCFEHSNWTFPNDAGLSTLQNLYSPSGGGGWPSNFEIPAAVKVRDCTNMRFERNIFRDLGGTGLMVYDDAVINLSVVGNVFCRTAAAALQLGDDDKKGPRSPQAGLYQALVSNNYFEEIGLQYGSPVVFGTFPYQLEFSQNEMFRSDMMGLNLGWGGLNQNDLLYRPLVRRNKFTRVNEEASDSAVYHTRNWTHGALVSDNWFDQSTKVRSGRLLGRYTTAFNDPKFGNLYLDNDARDNNLVRNVTTQFSRNGFEGRLDGHVTLGGRSTPNYIINASADMEEPIKSTAGLTPAYRDILTYSGFRSLGASCSPGEGQKPAIIRDDRDTGIVYQGIWTNRDLFGTDDGEGAYLSTSKMTQTPGSSVVVPFSGTGIEVIGQLGSTPINLEVQIDGKIVSSPTIESTSTRWQYSLLEVQGLAPGAHSLTLIWKSGGPLLLDAFIIYQSQPPGYFIKQSYENVALGKLPSNHIALPTPDTSIGVSAGANGNNALYIEDHSPESSASVRIDGGVVSSTAFLSFDLVPTQADAELRIELLHDATLVAKLALAADGTIIVHGAETATPIGYYSANQALFTGITADIPANQWHVTLNNLQFGPFPMVNAQADAINRLRFATGEHSMGSFHVDNLLFADAGSRQSPSVSFFGFVSDDMPLHYETWMGEVITSRSLLPWVFSVDHQWVYQVPSADPGFFFYSVNFSWLFASSATGRWLYLYALDQWAYSMGSGWYFMDSQEYLFRDELAARCFSL